MLGGGVLSRLKVIHAQESLAASTGMAEVVASPLSEMKFKEVARCVRDGVAETLAYTRFPMAHWRLIRTNNAIERLDREIRRRTRVVGAFPDGKSALMLVAARLKCVADGEWGRGGAWMSRCWTSDHAEAHGALC